MMPSSKINKRLIVAVFAETGEGKTHFGLTALGSSPGEKRIAALDFGNSTTHFDGRPDVPEFDVAHIDPAQDPEAQVLAQVAEIKKALPRYGLLLADDFGKAWSALCDLHPTKDGKPVGFGDWKDIRPKHRRMFNAILSVPLDIILTFREADDYEMRGSRPERVGAKLAGEGDTPYEPDLILHLQQDGKGRYGEVTKADRHGAYRVGQRIDAPTFQAIKAGIVGGGNPPTPDLATEDQKEDFKALIKWGLGSKIIIQNTHDKALAWIESATAEVAGEKIAQWRARKQEAEIKAEDERRRKISEEAGEPEKDPGGQPTDPPLGAGTAHHEDDPPEERSFVAMHVARTLDQDLASGRSRDDLAKAMLAHPGLNGSRTRLQAAWESAGDSEELQKAVLFQARTEILALK